MLLQLRTRLKRSIKKYYRNLLGLHSQYGEDFVVGHLLQALGIKNPGFYVDVGAHDPKFFPIRTSYTKWVGPASILSPILIYTPNF